MIWTLTLDITTEALGKLPTLDAAFTRRVTEDAALGIHDALVANFDRLAAESGSRYFWPQAAESVEKPVITGDTATVSIAKRGVRLQWKGGTVRPTGKTSEITGKPTRALLIPLPGSPLRGRMLGDIMQKLGQNEEIRPLESEAGEPYLALIRHYKRKVNGQLSKVTPLGILRASATISPHPDVIPSDAALGAAAETAAKESILAQMKNPAP